MNIKEYISSGILEAFVLGELSEKENQEVLVMANDYPEVKEELALIELSVEKMALQTAIAPPSHVKDKLFEEIASKPADAKPTKTKVVKMQSSTSSWKYMAAASVMLALVTSILAFNFYNKWKNTETELTSLIAQNERVADDYNQVNQQLEQIEEDLDIINNTAFDRIAMQGTDNAPQSLAYVYWNNSSEEVYVSIQNLKDLSEEHQYQLWAIIDGTPVDAGVFDKGDNNLFKMKNIASGAAAFAVTIEPKGGSVNPTLETMQVLGNVEKKSS